MQNHQQKLSILHINTTDAQGGAATSTMRLTQEQRKTGHDAKRLVGYKKTGSPTSFNFAAEPDPALHARCIQQGLQYYQFQGSHKLMHNPLVKDADILHFQNLHGDYFNPFSISVLTQMKPVVWTLRDMHAITGHCGYALDCEKWKTGCGNCPYLNNYPEILTDATAQLWQDKKLIYSHASLQIVTPSQWLKKLVEQSILQEHPVELIYNGTDTSVFKPYPKAEVRKKFNIPDDVPIIGAVAQGSALGNPYKGGQYTLKALEQLRSILPDFVFVNVGGDLPNQDPHILNFPYINDENELAQIYSSLDFFLFTTLADNCPLVVIEAMSCGVPLATFDTGGVPELVRDGIDGLVTPYKDVDSIVRSAYRLASDEPFRLECSRNARERTVELYDMQRVGANYDILYRKRIDTFQKEQATAIRLFPAASVPSIIKTPAFMAAEQFKQQLKTNVRIQTPVTSSETGSSQAASVHAGRLSFSRTTDKPPQHEYPVLVSAIVSTYNSEQFIRGCLDDLVNQTIVDQIEIIVVDSGSTQNEGWIVAEFQQKFDNIRYIRTEERESIYAAWNRGVKAARGKYITNANTDDRRRTDALEILSNTLENHPDIALAYADQLYTSVPNETFDSTASNTRRTWSEYSYQTLRSHCMVGPQPMWRRSLHEQYGYFDESFYAAGDWEFWLRIGKNEKFRKVDQVLGLYYVNPSGLENVHPSTIAEDARIKQKYHILPQERREPSFAIYERKKEQEIIPGLSRNSQKLVLFLHIDGLRMQDVENYPFLQTLARKNPAIPFTPSLSRVSRPALFGGISTSQFGFSSQVYFDPANSPFGVANALPPTLKYPSAVFESKEREFFNDFITGERITPFAAAILSGFDVPLEYLSFFDIAEKRSPWDKAPGYRSIFHELKERSIPWYRYSFPESEKSDSTDTGTLLQHILTDMPAQTRFAYIELNEILLKGQKLGPESQPYTQAIETTDRALEHFIRSLQSRYQQVEVVIISEYGLLPVSQKIDVWGMVERSSLKPGIDFQFFIEPHLARFWFYQRHAANLISKSLARLNGGKKLDAGELKLLGLTECDRRNGEMYFTPEEGNILYPNFICAEESAQLGIRNHSINSKQDNQGLLLMLRDGEYAALSAPVDALTVYRLLLEMLNIHSGD